jgi:hypothetical protein
VHWLAELRVCSSNLGTVKENNRFFFHVTFELQSFKLVNPRKELKHGTSIILDNH